MKVGIGGGTPATLASGLAIPVNLAVGATSLYWTADDGTVMKLAK